MLGAGFIDEGVGSALLSGIGHRSGSRLAQLLALGACALSPFAFASSESAAAAEPPGIAGYWHIDGRLAGNAIRLLCRFDQAQPDFAGLCFGDGTSAAGNFANGRAVWRWKVAGHVLTFDAMLDGDVLKGKVSTVAFAGIPVAGSFGAVRPEAEKAREPPQGKSALKEILGGLARGQLPAESCTAAFADGLRKQMPALQAAYAKLGEVRSISYVDTLHGSPKLATEIYEVSFSSARRLCSIDITKAGKLSDLVCAGG